MDYRVWRCDNCQICHIEGAKRWISNYDDCRRCGHRTVEVTSHTLRALTHFSEGQRESRRVCRYPGCGYQDAVLHTIPRLQRTTSSHSSSRGTSVSRSLS